MDDWRGVRQRRLIDDVAELAKLDAGGGPNCLVEPRAERQPGSPCGELGRGSGVGVGALHAPG
jgi:hypothetical protein